MKIAIDAMGGDQGLPVVIPAVSIVLQSHKDIEFILVGIESEITAMLEKYELTCYIGGRLTVVHASETISMDESPAAALRYKKDSSIRVAANLVKNGDADAVVSAGNTGALMAISKFVLKTIDGISRPAIVSSIPTIKGYSYILDLGANVNCSSNILYQFAVMGSVLKSSLSSSDALPKVALLNIGEEEIKGTEAIREAASLLSKNQHINYIGYIEGNNIYNDLADVIVCDGFVGNVALKTSEGLSQFFSNVFKEAYTKNLYTKFLGLLMGPIVKRIREKLDPNAYNGASLLGLTGIVVKSHGGANSKAFANAILKAKSEIENDVIGHLEKHSWMFKEENVVSENGK